MSVQMVLLPVFVLVGLSFALLLGMGATNARSLEAGETRLKDIALGPLPLLFYTLIALALPIRHADLAIVLLSWVFVVTRFAHAGIFITSNNDQQRSPAWLASVLVLFAMWLYFALKILLLL
jgi:MAPEG family protein